MQGDGSCTSIPQATSAAAEANACGNRRSCVTAFPATVRGGLLWAWPDTSPARWVEAAAAEVPLVPEVEGEEVVPLQGRWFVRDLPYAWDFFAENVLDPAHVDFAHHGIAGFDAAAFKKFEMVAVEDNGPAGFTFASRPLDPTRRGALHIFRPPSLITIRPGPDPEGADAAAAAKGGDVRPGSNNPNVLSSLLFYIVPTKPGWSRLHGCSWTTDREGKPLKSLSLFTNAMPTWVRHVLR
jgi:phenylpropionate dioxygenase-like ring-hydroxylating dioxygenase large terminal subunit